MKYQQGMKKMDKLKGQKVQGRPKMIGEWTRVTIVVESDVMDAVRRAQTQGVSAWIRQAIAEKLAGGAR